MNAANIRRQRSSHSASFRLLNELKDIKQDPSLPFYIQCEDSYMFALEAMFLGPPDTPYESGHFVFAIKIPPDYPTIAPVVKCLSTMSGTIRFNPNVYADGKVCLSLLGTWRGSSGENWNSAHGISSVLISIRSLFNERPYNNEPGYKANLNSTKSDLYNAKIIHETIRVTIVSRVESILSALKDSKPIDSLQYTSLNLFDVYYHCYLDIVNREMPKFPYKKEFTQASFENNGNGMRGSFVYQDLLDRLHCIKNELDAMETKHLARRQTEKPDFCCEFLLALDKMYETAVRETELFGVVEILRPDLETTPQRWEIILYCKEDTSYPSGVFRIQMVFFESFPESRPRVRFLTPFYHPFVSPDGYPFYNLIDNSCIILHLKALVDLVYKPPISDPGRIVNKEAGMLCFGTPEQKRLYLRKTRSIAESSLE